MPQSVALVVRINDFSYAANVSYASLNIMFLTACKCNNFLARAATIFKIPCGFLAVQLSLYVAHVYLSLT